MGSIQNTPVLPSGGTAGTTLATTANSAGGGDAFDGLSGAVKYDTAADGKTVYRVSGQGTTGSQQVVRWNNRQIDAQCVDVGIVRFNGVSSAGDEPFLRAAWGTTVGTEGGASFMLSLSNSGKLKVFIAGSSSATFLGTATLPTDNRELRVVVFRTAGTPGSADGTMRVRIFDGRTSTTAIEDTGLLTGLALVGTTAGAGFENIRWLKYGSEILAGSVDLGYAGLYWGTTDAVSTSTYPLAAPVTASLSGVVTPSAHTVGTVQTLTLTPTGFTPTSYSGTWDGVAWGPQSSNVVTHTDDPAKAGQTIPWTATARND